MNFEPKKISQQQSVWLDFLRGISAQLVLLGHLLSFNGIQHRYSLPLIQNFGVVVFFVLSGYLITQTSILKGREYGFKKYMIDRFARIYFSFFPALVLITIGDYLILKDITQEFNNSVLNWLGNLLMIQALPFHDLWNIEAFGSARVFWTVSVEWWFYIFFGILYFANRRSSQVSIKLLPIFLIALMTVLHYFESRGNGLSVYWLFGFGLSMLINFSNPPRSGVFSKKKTILYLGLIFFIMSIRAVCVRDMYDVTIAISIATILYLLSYTDWEINKKGFFSTFSKLIASYSYSLYLIHYSIIVYYKSFGYQVDFTGILFLFLVCNLFSYFFYILFEKRFYLLKRHLKNSLWLRKF